MPASTPPSGRGPPRATACACRSRWCTARTSGGREGIRCSSTATARTASRATPGFDPDRLTLLDRGFVYAIAHIRGGQELGRAWYEDGKLLHKMNTFTDFIDCAEHLVASGWADRSRLFAMGGSAGGLLMGAVVNLRPDLFRGVVARVPFVDVVTTMLDDSIPLTTGGVRRVGRSQAARGLRLHALVLALRQRQGGRLPEPAGDRRLPRLAGAVLRAGQVGGQAARHQDRRRPRCSWSRTWKRDTAASRGASAGATRPR